MTKLKIQNSNNKTFTQKYKLQTKNLIVLSIEYMYSINANANDVDDDDGPIASRVYVYKFIKISFLGLAHANYLKSFLALNMELCFINLNPV